MSLAIVALFILFFGMFGGLISLGLQKIHIKSRFAKRLRDLLIFILALFSLVMAFSLAISSAALAIRLLGAIGLGLALYSLLKLFKQGSGSTHRGL